MRFLLLTLYAPMGSFGEIAVGERRMSWARPGRSAVLGLVAAASGIERTDEDAHRNLEAGLYYAVRTDAPGRPFIDYHTAQTPKARKGRTFATRRGELESGDLHTVLSSREWRSDACFTVSCGRESRMPWISTRWPTPCGAPCFTLYLGRKSAPLGLPLNPAVIEADTFMDCLRQAATECRGKGSPEVPSRQGHSADHDDRVRSRRAGRGRRYPHRAAARRNRQPHTLAVYRSAGRCHGTWQALGNDGVAISLPCPAQARCFGEGAAAATAG